MLKSILSELSYEKQKKNLTKCNVCSNVWVISQVWVGISQPDPDPDHYPAQNPEQGYPGNPFASFSQDTLALLCALHCQDIHLIYYTMKDP
jgi:hypothetical protein